MKCVECKYFEPACSILLNKNATDETCNWDKSKFQPKECEQNDNDNKKR